MLNPMDFLLWLSEEMETRDWDSNLVGTQIGLSFNFVFLLARANSGRTAARDDIFAEDDGPGWVSFLVSCIARPALQNHTDFLETGVSLGLGPRSRLPFQRHLHDVSNEKIQDVRGKH